MSERTAGGRDREKESHAGQRGVVGALRERGPAGPCPSAQARSGEGQECGEVRVKASGAWLVMVRPGSVVVGQGRLLSGPSQISFGSAGPSGVMWGPTGQSR